MLEQFINLVKKAEDDNQAEIVIPIEAASAAKNLLEKILAARKKGGQNRHKNTVLKTDPEAVKNRERVSRFKEKKKNQLK